jgi:putative toxin-antitoxin system antitoxin component (TIGR02293 family)
MTTLFDTAKLLEVPEKNRPLRSAVQYLTYVDKGLPVRSLDRIAHAIAPADAAFRYRIVPKATLARLKTKRRLNKSQGEIVTRLAEVWTDATRVWKTDEAARGFLNRKHPLLDNKRPIDLMLQSEIGAQLVRDVLGRLEHGIAV